MLTNGVCTVVRMDDDDAYAVIGVYPCSWQEVEGYEVKKYGEETADKAAVYIPDPSADVLKGDYICRGEISGEPDVRHMLTVMSVTRYDIGVKHTKVGAR